jgi:hypothetical protein
MALAMTSVSPMDGLDDRAIVQTFPSAVTAAQPDY